MRVDRRYLRAAKHAVAGGTAVACVWAAAVLRTEEGEVDLVKGTAVEVEVSGSSIGDLHPGAVRRTRVTVTNPFPFAIAVRSVEARVVSTSQRRCRPADMNLRVGSYLGTLPLSVPKHGRNAAGEFEVTMPGTVVDACKKATFKLAFTATATRVDR